MSDKRVPESPREERVQSAETLTAQEPVAANVLESKQQPGARILGQPEGPFGTACVSRNVILLRSLGTTHFSRFETAEVAPHGIFIAVNNLQSQPFKAKTTLLDFQLFLGDPQVPGNKIIKGIGRIEEIRAVIEVPAPTPPGYIFRILQLSAEELAQLELHVHETLLKVAM